MRTQQDIRNITNDGDQIVCMKKSICVQHLSVAK